MPSRVPVNIPPAAAVPIALIPTAPAPEANTKGIRPPMNAREVIIIGLNLERAPSLAASCKEWPAFLF